ncbi:MAG: putative O-glycosylation ligase, exosortase A system-associated [Rubrivivax sp.]|nr:putative O-glycosylation ligase, exosortase A system-associated [Rubrivivax sp.]
MRDIVLSAIVAAALMMVFKHPVVGAYLWAWLGLMNPHKMTYGFARALPFAQVTAIVTIGVLVFTARRQPLPTHGVARLQIVLLLWMTVTSFFALAPTDLVWERWIFVMKIQVMLFVTWMLVRSEGEIRGLVWVIVLSVGYFGVKGGIFTVLTGGNSRVWGPPGGMLEENNALAVALIMIQPMIYFLRETEKRRWVRFGLLFAMIACGFSILGSQSRGALLALVAMALVLGLRGKRPLRDTVVILGVVGGAVAFMPETWSSRMQTIATYEEDGSAMSRIWTWTTLWNAAVDRPLVGAGFRADHFDVFERYAPVLEGYGNFGGALYVAHSIYFQMLGEHGFIGLAIFVALFTRTWLTAGRLANECQRDPRFGQWLPLLMRMTQVSVVGFAVGGAFLSLANLDLPYYFCALVVLCDALVRRDRGESGSLVGKPAIAAAQ